MADVSTSTAPGDSSSSEGGIWRGLRSLIFGTDASETLRERIEEVIAAHEDENDAPVAGDLSPIERKMLRNILHFGERDAGDMGVPRADIVALEENTPFADVVKLFAEAGHSRLPVYREKLDTIVGMVHVKDVFAILAKGEEPPPTAISLLRQPLYVPQSMGTLDLLAQMQASRTHLAIVLDEYSGTDGLITIEDLVEEIVGAIEDEHDEAPTDLFVPLDGGAWEADARAELEDAAELIDPRLGEVEEDVETLGGLAFVLAGEVPKQGTCLDHPSGWRIEIIAADTRRVLRLRLHPPLPAVEE
ncbi:MULTISPECIES: hemolysin family protein [Sphingomonas]|jgi:CBS domain containing-hemolysin-like protein|uniref:Magnesium/cobalt efflux protein n=1 Tax=Sphingomonas hankookensis TaxID=563996 RepID=A0ABR5YDW7_9SPHN|nr:MULTISPECIES: hemolysin family protein [Sphingomonas]KZE16295.1 magnesium/cobalt efflux protein [Sphingomonas hankookensis]PZT92810.1 MAG: HlyC/CorC family transporter [Sphingomonas sp.]RSV31833.1 HlyC/CorC family transporter [Sphingomonas sp. ABOLH]WCP71426.1 hemolysin family protein [Sphingomonas hankookensis]